MRSGFVLDRFQGHDLIKGLEVLPVSTCVYRADKDMTLLYANDLAARLYECDSASDFNTYTKGSLLSLPVQENIRDIAGSISEQISANDDSAGRVYYRILAANGSLKYIESYFRLVDDSNDGLLLFVFSIEVSETRTPVETDELTGFPDRKHFLEYTESLMNSNSKSDRPTSFSFIYFNLTNFKSFNIRYGIGEGDLLLQSLASIISSVFSESYVCRISEDHFVVCSESVGIVRKIEELRDRFYSKSRNRLMGVKAGIYNLVNNSVTPAVACDLAKYACDYIKQDADALYYVYEPGIERRNELENYLVQNLDDAMAKGYIKVFYQPVIRTLTGAVCGLEALSRWIDPHKGFLSPGDFIPVLEKRRLIHKLDIFIVNEVCRNARERLDDGRSAMPVSFNLSRHDFLLCDPFLEVEKAAEKYDIPRNLLRIEITESTLMENPERIRLAIEKFHQTGYQVWMDDFGSGYSSLNVLKDFNFDEIKIDMMFLSNFNERSKTIIKHTIKMAKNLGMETLAEGVETEEQFNFLRDIGCQKVQGFFFGKPMSKADVRRFIDNNAAGEENGETERFYSQAGMVNFKATKAFALIDYDDDVLSHCYASSGYLQAFSRMGFPSQEAIEKFFNDRTSPTYKAYRKFFDRVINSDEDCDTTLVDVDNTLHIVSRVVARVGNRYMFEVELDSIKLIEASRRQHQIDSYVRSLAHLYDQGFILHLRDNYAEELMQNSSFIDFGTRTNDIRALREFFANKSIHGEDYNRYMAFSDPDTLVERIKSSERGFIQDVFRQLDREDGSYSWKTHTAILLPKSNDSIVLEFIRPTTEESTKPYRDSSIISKEVLWDTLMKNTSLKFFWKDTDARFAGASKPFIDYYDLSSIAEIEGRTEEDIGWNIDGPTDHGKEESDVLRYGRTHRNIRLQNIVRGSVHNIIASEYPAYDNGRIVGLLGRIEDVESENRRLAAYLDSSSIDPATGLMNARAASRIAMKFDENYHLMKTDYAVVLLDILNFEALYNEHGDRFAHDLLERIGSMIQEHLSVSSAAARIAMGRFVIYSNSSDHKFIQNKARESSSAIESIDNISGVPISLKVSTVIAFASETDTAEGLNNLLQQRLLEKADVSRKRKKGRSISYEVDFNTDIPIAFAVCKAVMDESGKSIVDVQIVYMNQSLNELGIFAKGSASGKFFSELYDCCRSDWLDACYESAILGKRLKGRVYNDTIKHWIDYVIAPARSPGYCTYVFIVADDVARQGKDLNREFLTDDSILRLAKVISSNDDYDTMMQKALTEMSHILHPERIDFLEIEGDSVRAVFEWCADGVESLKEHIHRVPYSFYKYMVDILDSDTCVYIPDASAYNGHHNIVTELMVKYGINRLIAAPMYDDGRLMGFLCVDDFELSNRIDFKRLVTAVAGFFAARTVNHHLIQQMDLMQRHDALTGVMNRIALMEREREIEAEDVCVGVVFTDVNELKTTNDQFGHGAGDILLRSTADLLCSIYGLDNVYRAGGDEFIVLLPSISREEFDRKRDELLYSLMERKDVKLAKGFEWSENSDEIVSVIKRADKKMYADKASYYTLHDRRNRKR